jgi:hypothetical protein
MNIVPFLPLLIRGMAMDLTTSTMGKLTSIVGSRSGILGSVTTMPVKTFEVKGTRYYEAKAEVGAKRAREKSEVKCSIPDDHISPRRSALFMARSVLRDILGEVRAC